MAPKKTVNKFSEILENCDAPASVVAGDGSLLYTNPTMQNLILTNPPAKPLRCEWIHKTGDSCSECGERSFVDGRCFVTPNHSKGAALYSAIRLPTMDNALACVYALPGPKAAQEAENTAKKLLTLASASHLDDLSPSGGRDGEIMNLRLKELFDTLQNLAGVRNLSIINNLDHTLRATAINPSIILQTATEILHELYRLDPTATIEIDHNMEATVRGGIPSHNISLAMETTLRPAGKALASGLSAATIRLENFARLLSHLTGYNIETPKVLRRRETISIHFSFPDTMRKKSSALRFSGSIYKLMTPREEEIFEMVKAGYNNSIISSRLKISPATVKQNLKNIYRKAKVKNRTGLIFKY